MAHEAEAMDDTIFTAMVNMCFTMHVTVRDKSTQYAEEMRRYNYVTPTSYLELISTIKQVP